MITLASNCHCCIYRSKDTAGIHRWPFAQALIVALYLITSASNCYCYVYRSKGTAVLHCWPFAQALMVAWYVALELLLLHLSQHS